MRVGARMTVMGEVSRQISKNSKSRGLLAWTRRSHCVRTRGPVRKDLNEGPTQRYRRGPKGGRNCRPPRSVSPGQARSTRASNSCLSRAARTARDAKRGGCQALARCCRRDGARAKHPPFGSRLDVRLRNGAALQRVQWPTDRANPGMKIGRCHRISAGRVVGQCFRVF